MARYLAIDCDGTRLHVLAVASARDGAKALQSASLDLPEELTSASAAKLGEMVRDGLKEAGIAPAPVLWAYGRDRFVFKEFSIPYAQPHEEPALVRFQASKEFADGGADAADFAHLEPAVAGRPTRVLAIGLRRSAIQAVTTLCQSAGLKLETLAPRPYAAVGLAHRAPKSETIALAHAVVVPTRTGAEFSLVRGRTLAWARGIPAGVDLSTETQRNLILLASQSSDGAPPVVLAPTRANLQLRSARVEPLDVWRPDDATPATPDEFLAALGLAEAFCRGDVPVNLASPKEPKPPLDFSRRKKALALIAVGVLVPALLLYNYLTLKRKRDLTAAAVNAKLDRDAEWKKLDQDRLNVKAIKDWEETSVSWADEIYDVAARLPHVQGLKIIQFSAAPLPRRGPGDKEVARITLHGVMTSDQDGLVNQFLDALRSDPRLRVAAPHFRGQDFTLKIDVAPQSRAKYANRLVVPPQPKYIPPPEPEPEPEVVEDPQ